MSLITNKMPFCKLPNTLIKYTSLCFEKGWEVVWQLQPRVNRATPLPQFQFADSHCFAGTLWTILTTFCLPDTYSSNLAIINQIFTTTIVSQNLLTLRACQDSALENFNSWFLFPLLKGQLLSPRWTIQTAF